MSDFDEQAQRYLVLIKGGPPSTPVFATFRAMLVNARVAYGLQEKGRPERRPENPCERPWS